MIPGDPFHTEELDELRADQRRILNWIPRWIMDQIADEANESVPDADRDVSAVDRTHAELVLRRYVRDEVLDGESELIDKMRRSTEGEMIGVATQAIAGSWYNDLAIDARRHYEGSYMREIDEVADEAQRIRTIRRALLVAESLSDDTDRRAPETAQQPTSERW